MQLIHGTRKIWLPMKLTALFLFLALFHVSGKVRSQNVSISGRNIPLAKLFHSIEHQTGYVFFYSPDVLNDTKTVSISVKDAALTDVLNYCLKEQQLSYSIVEKTIFIKKAARMAAVAVTAVTDSIAIVNHQVLVHVTDSTGKPLAGATVLIKGTKTGGQTNDDGNITLSVPDGAVLSISFIGYVTKEISPEDNPIVAVQLKTDAQSLQDYVVEYNNGYQSIPKERAAGSFAQPDKLMFDGRVTTNILDKLNGITNGVVFTPRGSGHNNIGIQIRGISTINANATPLIIVDNFPYDGDIKNINPNDVASVTILKDAGATSIWGAQAGNGVIVITTKRGKYIQPVQVNGTMNFTISPKPDLKTDRAWINSGDYIDIEKQLFGEGYYDADLANTKTFPVVSPVVQLLAAERAGTLSSSDADAQINALRNNDVRNQLSRYYYRPLVNQQYNINMSGGTPNANFIMSANYDKDLAVLQDNDDHRFTFSTYGNYKPVKNLEIGAGINYTQSQTESNSTYSDTRYLGSKTLWPYAQLADAEGNPLALNKYSNLLIDHAVADGFLDWSYYPLKDIGQNSNTVTLNDIRLQAQVKYTIIKGLSIQGNYQYEYGDTKNSIYHSDSSYFARDLINRYSTVANGIVTVRNIPVGGILDGSDNSFTSKTGRAQVNFSRDFGKHSVNILGGFEAKELLSTGSASPTLYGYGANQSDNYQAVNFLEPVKMFPSGAGFIPNAFSINHLYNRYRSLFTNASYTYNNLYTLQGSIRSDKANLFGVNANKKGIPLWSAGGLWNVSGESFYHIAWLPVLKLRATYGYSGNLPTDGSAYAAAVFLPGNSNLTPVRAGLIGPGNLDLTWEKDAQTNVGIDFGLKNNIVTGSIEYYRKKGSDLIGVEPIAPSTGFSRATINYAGMTGHGLDLQLNSMNIHHASFNWTSYFSLSYATDKVTNYNTTFGANVANYTVVVGKPLEGLYAYRWAGLDPANGDPQGTDSTGKVSKEYSSLTNYPISKQKYMGSQIPLVFGNLRNTFNYKRLSLSFNLSYQFDYYFKRPTINYSALFASGVADKDYYRRWQHPGDEMHTSVPSMPTSLPVDGNRDNFYGGSEAVVTKGDHIRIQDLLLTYSLSDPIARKLSMKSLHVSFYVSNLNWILWRANKYGIDPNQASGYKIPTSFAFSLQAGF